MAPLEEYIDVDALVDPAVSLDAIAVCWKEIFVLSGTLWGNNPLEDHTKKQTIAT